MTWNCKWKNTLSTDYCADRINVITNVADITNVVIKRVYCINIFVSRCTQGGGGGGYRNNPSTAVRTNLVSTTPSTSFIRLIWNLATATPPTSFIDLFEFCRLSSYDMKMCMWIWNLESTKFDGLICHADVDLSHYLRIFLPTFADLKSCVRNFSFLFRRTHLICRSSTDSTMMFMLFWNFNLTIVH